MRKGPGHVLTSGTYLWSFVITVKNAVYIQCANVVKGNNSCFLLSLFDIIFFV